MLLKRISTIKKVIEKNNEPSYRLKQINSAVFGPKKIKRWEDIPAVPTKLKEDIVKELGREVLTIKPASIQKSAQAVKMLFQLHDGQSIEAVYMKFLNGKTSLCISSQVGCALKCNFCATGAVGFKRQLTADEITDQILYFQQNGNVVDSVSLMGMGEALQNPKVFDAITMLTDKDLFAMHPRKISVSTVGIVPGIERLTKDFPQVNVAFSLHSPFEEQRNILVPTNKIFPLPLVMKTLENHAKVTNRKIFLAYLVLDGFNDSEEHAKEIVQLIRRMEPSVQHLFHVNLLRYNPAEGIAPEYTRTDEDNLARFDSYLSSRGITTTTRRSFGVDIDAACGQLYKVSQKILKEKRELKESLAL